MLDASSATLLPFGSGSVMTSYSSECSQERALCVSEPTCTSARREVEIDGNDRRSHRWRNACRQCRTFIIEDFALVGGAQVRSLGWHWRHCKPHGGIET
jgi:hypothetical protein